MKNDWFVLLVVFFCLFNVDFLLTIVDDWLDAFEIDPWQDRRWRVENDSNQNGFDCSNSSSTVVSLQQHLQSIIIVNFKFI